MRWHRPEPRLLRTIKARNVSNATVPFVNMRFASAYPCVILLSRVFAGLYECAYEVIVLKHASRREWMRHRAFVYFFCVLWMRAWCMYTCAYRIGRICTFVSMSVLSSIRTGLASSLDMSLSASGTRRLWQYRYQEDIFTARKAWTRLGRASGRASLRFCKG